MISTVWSHCILGRFFFTNDKHKFSSFQEGYKYWFLSTVFSMPCFLDVSAHQKVHDTDTLRKLLMASNCFFLFCLFTFVVVVLLPFLTLSEKQHFVNPCLFHTNIKLLLYGPHSLSLFWDSQLTHAFKFLEISRSAIVSFWQRE